jgi:protease IV
LVRGGSEVLGFGAAEELREAVRAFRASGKPAVFFAESFGEFSPGRSSYYLATAFDSISMQPSGDVGLVGLSSASPFLKQTLDSLGIEPLLENRHEYKTIKNIFTEERYTESHRQADERVIKSISQSMLEAIAEARGLSIQEVETLVEEGPYLGREAAERGLVDELRYRDEVFAQVREKVGEEAEFLFLRAYYERAGSAFREGEPVALIYGVGPVLRGESDFSPAMMTSTLGSETVTAALRAAVDDEVKAILFRIDSPGGSYVASDAIWREIGRARKAGIPVIATLGNVAASGGYFVAMGADKIVAQPSTVTGSIGVVGGKFLTRAFWDKLGVSWGELYTAESATLWSNLQEYTPHTEARFQAWLDHVYDDFTAKVAEGRGLSREDVYKVARGRIWTGRDALQIKLVDTLGGFSTALALAREAAGLPVDARVKLVPYPAPRTFLERFRSRGRENSERTALVAVYREIIGWLQPALRVLRQLGVGDKPQVLSLPAAERYRFQE